MGFEDAHVVDQGRRIQCQGRDVPARRQGIQHRAQSFVRGHLHKDVGGAQLAGGTLQGLEVMKTPNVHLTFRA